MSSSAAHWTTEVRDFQTASETPSSYALHRERRWRRGPGRTFHFASPSVGRTRPAVADPDTPGATPIAAKGTFYPLQFRP